MTRDEILSMSAGRETDVLIAEKVMGWTRAHVGSFGTQFWNTPNESIKAEPAIPDYSTEIHAAWDVIEVLERDWEVEISTGHNFRDYPGQSYGCRIANKRVLSVMFCLAESAPLAICRAALLAVNCGPNTASTGQVTPVSSSQVSEADNLAPSK